MLDVYRFDEDNNSYIKVSENGLQTSPVQSTHNGTEGETVSQKLFIKADDSSYYYTDISLKSVPESYVKVGSPSFPEAYIVFKIIVQDDAPTDDQWRNAISGDTVEFSDVGSATQGDLNPRPFWIQIGIPSGTPPGTLTNVSLSLTRSENPVSP